MKSMTFPERCFPPGCFPATRCPAFRPVLELEKGAPCSLTQLSLGSHSATHMDAPSHFLPGGEPSTRWSSPGAWALPVLEARGHLSGAWARAVMGTGAKRVLLKGEVEISLEAAEEWAKGGLLLLGVEGMTVGP